MALSWSPSGRFAYWKERQLGQGATGRVFPGYIKGYEKTYAMKIITKSEDCRRMDVQRREIDIMRKLRHGNIVAFKGEEISPTTRIVAMELCNGGSLASMLEQPKYYFGLPNKKVIWLLSDIADGVDYLRTNKVYHRDIKPANILIDNSQTRIIFKLADFGSSIDFSNGETSEQQEFLTICGTQEFMSPEEFGLAVLHLPKQSPITPITDVWSIGCTLFQAITGYLPFRVKGGRSNPMMMYNLLLNKPPKTISGVQLSEKEQITWSSKLPSNCRIGWSLKQLLEPLLQQCMAKENRMTFDELLSSAREIKTRCPVHVLNFNTLEMHILYLQRTDNRSTLKVV